MGKRVNSGAGTVHSLPASPRSGVVERNRQNKKYQLAVTGASGFSQRQWLFAAHRECVLAIAAALAIRGRLKAANEGAGAGLGEVVGGLVGGGNVGEADGAKRDQLRAAVLGKSGWSYMFWIWLRWLAVTVS